MKVEYLADHPSHLPTVARLIDSITDVYGILDRPVIGERKRRRPSDGYAGR